MKINIIGAGMSGLLAANVLRRHDVIVYEKQSSLPNNHHAVLRFRTSNIGDVLGIQFKKVNMLKTHVQHSNLVADSISYSKKCTGIFRSDRSIVEGTVTAERYVAPPDLIDQMANNIDIKFDAEYNFKDSKLPTISTIPMPSLMMALNYPCDIDFKKIHGIVISAQVLDCDAYISVLFPDPTLPYSRATITGNQLIIEFPKCDVVPDMDLVDDMEYFLGLFDAEIFDIIIKDQRYFKILPINEAERIKFMRWASVNHNVYSLGRYATWRPKLLLDDLIGDLKKIESWIQGGDR